MKQVLLSGVKPTGAVHIGNYFGAIKQFVDLTTQYETYIFVADLHALTSIKDRKTLEEGIIDTAITYLAAGIDPKKVTLFKQSDTPQLTELAWTFNCLTTMPYLMRAHAFKDAEAKNKEINVGVFDYPILMAADILLPHADVVPVGKDQEQHVEIARDLAEKFNRTYGDTFKLPKAIIDKDVATVPGTDGQKMSKSYGNVISLFASDEEIEKLVMTIPTDSTPITEGKNPDTSNLFNIHKLLLTEEEVFALRQKYTTPGMSYKEAKDMLINDLKRFIAPFRERRAYWIKNRNKVVSILAKGGKKMHDLAEKRMKDIRKKIGVSIY
jgi:tryptophanyl-tRNA synthetase